MTLRSEIASRIIDPQALIKQAESQADAMVSLVSDNQDSSDKSESFSIDPNSTVTKQAEDILKAIDSYVENSQEDENLTPAKQAEVGKVDDSKKVEAGSGEGQEKSAAAKILELLILDEVTTDALIKQGKEVSLVPGDLDRFDLDVLNEKVAFNLKGVLGKIKKPFIGAAKVTGLVGAGYVGGRVAGNERLKKFITADAEQDKTNIQKSYRYGQLAMYQALAGNQGGSNG